MVKNKRSLRKPSGITGPIKVEVRPNGAEVEFQAIDFPKTKEKIEDFIVKSFLNAAQQQNILQIPSFSVRQNELDDFDFTIETLSGNKYLELMEIAPLEHLKASYDKAPSSYKSYDFAKYILKKINDKSNRYAASIEYGLLLLIYVKDYWDLIKKREVLEGNF
jgi:hypothetical protein